MELQSSTVNDEYLLQRKFEMIIDTNNKRIANELNNIKSVLSKLSEEINDVRREISERASNENLRKKESKPVIAEKVENEQCKPPTEKNAQQSLRPRYGDYNPEDVSVTKFFYFGNKK